MNNLLYSPVQPVLSPSALQQLPLRVQMQPGAGLLQSIVYRFIKLSATGPCHYPVIPDTSYALYFSPHCAMFSVGLKRRQTLYLPASGDYYGIHFYPGALACLFRRDYSEIGGEVTDAHFLPAEFVDHLQEIFYTSASFRLKIAQCESVMGKLLSPTQLQSRQTQAMQMATTYLYRLAGNVRIDHLAKLVAYSERQLNRLFQISTGLNTKTFANIIRFQSVLRQSDESKLVSISRMLEHGYYDQSHFLKDYRRFIKA